MVCGGKLVPDGIVLINGKISVKDDRLTVICGSITADTEFERSLSNMKLCIKTASSEATFTNEFTELCSRNSGSTVVCLYLTDMKKTVIPRSKLSVKVTKEFWGELKKHYDPSQIGLIQ